MPGGPFQYFVPLQVTKNMSNAVVEMRHVTISQSRSQRNTSTTLLTYNSTYYHSTYSHVNVIGAV